jgi:hypothetical protein
MRTLLITAETMEGAYQRARTDAPWSAYLLAVVDGFIAYESVAEYEQHMKNAFDETGEFPESISTGF